MGLKLQHFNVSCDAEQCNKATLIWRWAYWCLALFLELLNFILDQNPQNALITAVRRWFEDRTCYHWHWKTHRFSVSDFWTQFIFSAKLFFARRCYNYPCGGCVSVYVSEQTLLIFVKDAATVFFWTHFVLLWSPQSGLFYISALPLLSTWVTCLFSKCFSMLRILSSKFKPPQLSLLLQCMVCG